MYRQAKIISLMYMVSMTIEKLRDGDCHKIHLFVTKTWWLGATRIRQVQFVDKCDHAPYVIRNRSYVVLWWSIIWDGSMLEYVRENASQYISLTERREIRKQVYVSHTSNHKIVTQLRIALLLTWIRYSITILQSILIFITLNNSISL